METVGRFAPSPSGRIHLGNMLCSLLAWLSARQKGGKVVLRIEDLDTARCKRAYAEQMIDDLLWLGLDWDEGPGVGGPEEPYWQSERTVLYEQALETLREKGLVYPCFCTRSELHAASAPHRSDGQTIYAGTCRGLTDSQRAEKQKTPAWRLAVPDRTFSFTDGLQGFFSENLAAECGDFIIRRADGVFAYQLAVVADDGEGGITQVVRGMDLLDSTPRQLYLYELLGLQPPEFYHVPLLVAPDGRRLSKRERDLDLGALRQTYTAEEILGKLAHLAGLLEKPEKVSAAELALRFDWAKVQRNPIVLQDF